jgi:hypothetical protein
MKWPFGKGILLSCKPLTSWGFLPTNFLPLPLHHGSGQRFMSTTTTTTTNDLITFPPTPRFDDKFFLPKRNGKLPLSIENGHPNDSNLSFDPIEHKYFYKSKPLDISITGLVSKYFPEFKADEVIPKMMAGTNWPRKDYQYKDGTPYTAEEIKFKWDQIGLYSRNRGTWMHYNIESFLNGQPYNPEGPEMQFFLKFYEDYFKSIKPYRTEWTIAAPDRGIGGTVDFVGQLESGNYCIMDWKRSKGLAEGLTNNYGKHAL